MLINKTNVRKLIADNSTTIKQVDRGFYFELNLKLNDMILSAIKQNGGRTRLNNAAFMGLKPKRFNCKPFKREGVK